MTSRDRVRGRKPANGRTKHSAAIVLVKGIAVGDRHGWQSSRPVHLGVVIMLCDRTLDSGCIESDYSRTRLGRK